jgi:hypothetical protein
MKTSPLSRLLPLGLCLLSLCFITGAVALTHPNCTDPALKSFLGLSARWLPWIACGFVVGKLHPKQWLAYGFGFFLVVYPIITYLWMKRAFVGWGDWSHYWLLLSTPRPLIVVGCLTVAGSFSGSLSQYPGTHKRAIFGVAASVTGFFIYTLVSYSGR